MKHFRIKETVIITGVVLIHGLLLISLLTKL